MAERVAELRRLIRWLSGDAREGKRKSGEGDSRGTYSRALDGSNGARSERGRVMAGVTSEGEVIAGGRGI
jgi:hypothetical protein